MRRIWEAFKNFNRRANEAILAAQEKTSGFYNDWFTLKASLAFALIVGATFAFVGGDCYGKVSWINPIAACLTVVALFFFFQTFVLVPLTLWRIFRLLLVMFCGHYLAYQSYGFWSLENVEAIKTASLSSLVDPLLAESLQEINGSRAVCKPYVYANITYGYFWVFVPAILLVLAAFWDGKEEEVEDE